MLVFPPQRKTLVRKRVIASVIVGIFILYSLRRSRREIAMRQVLSETALKLSRRPIGSSGQDRISLDRRFLEQLWYILRILIPEWQSYEFGLVMLHTSFLVARTALSVSLAALDGALVKSLVTQDSKAFIRGLFLWFMIAIPATYTNSMIKFTQSKMAIAFRTQLTKYIHSMYLTDHVFYKVLQLDRRIDHPDQYITADIIRFCDALSELFSNMAKPSIDMILFSIQLSRYIGWQGTGVLFSIYFITAYALKRFAPPFGKLAAKEAQLEGLFRACHSRIIMNAEEIAFYKGQKIEEKIISSCYRILIRHLNRVSKMHILYGMLEDLFVKYGWSAVGLVVCALPLQEKIGLPLANLPDSSMQGNSLSEVHIPHNEVTVASSTQHFITTKRLMMNLADAGGRMMYSYKGLSEFSGYTSRVTRLLEILRDMKEDRFTLYLPNHPTRTTAVSPYSMDDLHGQTILLDKPSSLSFKHVPVVTPSGELLVRAITFTIHPGDHLMITGPNGSGKTSIIRILSGLWPLFEGILMKPKQDIMYISQRAYFVLGTLRDQLLYPDTVEHMRKSGRTDTELFDILEKVHLQELVEREGGWDTVRPWKDVLSGGEKQRICMARLFYHRPKFAVLDDCTSAISADVEWFIYTEAKNMGISLITVSHRPFLFRYHRFLLKLDGIGNWEFTALDSRQEIRSLVDEVRSLRERLAEVPSIRARLNEIQAALRLVAS